MRGGNASARIADCDVAGSGDQRGDFVLGFAAEVAAKLRGDLELHAISWVLADAQGGASTITAWSGTVSRMRLGDAGWRPAWPGSGAGSVARRCASVASSGQIFCQSSGRRALREVVPSVACSIAKQLSIGTPRSRQFPRRAGLTSIFSARAERPPQYWIA